MKRLVIYLFLIQFLSNCIHEKNETIYYYDQYYGQYNDFYYKNAVIIKSKPVSDKENKITIEGQPGKYWFYEDFFENYIPNIGIYRKFENDYILCYRFDSIGVSQYIDNHLRSPFIKSNISLSDKRVYMVDGKKYAVYAYGESEGSSGMTSYYLEDFGFIAYVFNNGYYILCNRISKYNDYINNKILKEINSSLTKDTCFFDIYLHYPDTLCLEKK